MANNVFVVFTNPVEGQDEAYNQWYDTVHVPDVLKLEGVVGAKRYRLSDTQMSDQHCEYRYMALYELDTDDIALVRDQILAKAGTAEMVISPSMDPNRSRFFFLPIFEQSH